MSFTVTFSRPIAVTTFTACSPICTFTSTDGGSTFTTTGSPTILVGFQYLPGANEYLYLNGVSNIPNSVTSIGASAFQDCWDLTSFIVPNNVTQIGTSAFSACHKLASITIPNSVSVMGDRVFQVCDVLRTITLPNTLQSIGIYMFSQSGLTNITIPNSVTTIGRNAFGGCNSLTSVTIGDGVTTIGLAAFTACSVLTSVTIGNGVTNIGLSAFDACSSLTSVTMGNSVITISSAAFRNCPLSSITLPNTLTTIESVAFQNTQITSLTLPDNLTTFDFYGMNKITNYTVNSSNPNYSSINGILYNKSGTILLLYPIGKPDITFVIPNGVTTINSNAFAGTTSLKSVTFPTSITTISSDGFRESSLSSITIPSTVTSFGNDVFRTCRYLTSVTLLNNITTIPSGTFIDCPFQSFVIPDGVTSINSSAFQNCNYLSSIIIPTGVTSLSAFAFGGCTSLKQITVPSTLTSIPANAFTNLPFPVNVYTSPVDNTNPAYNFFTSNFTSSQVTISFPPIPPLPIIPCFNKDTKILTIDGYMPIQDLRKGDLVKTINHEFVPINMIGCKTIANSKDEIPPNKLFVCSNENYPEITEDLYITGLHSILVDELTKEEESNLFELFGKKFVTDGKYRLPVFMDKRANLHEESGEYTIYHIALDHENELMNYGIYANGLLVETCCIKYLKEHSNMDLIE